MPQKSQWEWRRGRQPELRKLGYNRPDAGNEFFGYRFPMEPESVCEHTQDKQVCRSPGNKGGCPTTNIAQHLLNMQHKCDRFTVWSSSTCQLPRHYLCCEDVISIFRELLVMEAWREISLIPNYFLNGHFSVCYNITLWLMLTKGSFPCLIWLSSLQSQLNIHNWVTHWWRFSGSIQPWKTLLKAKSPRSQIRSLILMLAPTGNITTRRRAAQR